MLLTNRPTALLVVLACLGAPISACGTAAPKAPPVVPTAELPPYTTEQQRLFDDSIAPEVFGLDVERGEILTDEFTQLVHSADYITRVKLQTINSDKVSGQIRYSLILKPVDKPLLGFPTGRSIEITVGRTSPSLTLLRSMATEGVGKTMLVILKNYRLDGEQVIHFRGEADTDAMASAIRQVLAKKKE